jgi:hypothetical protein
MTREEAWLFIKGQLEDYLQSTGINTKKPFTCLNPQHEDRNPSMRYDSSRNKAHCFSCDADYDTLDVIRIRYGLTDSKEIFNKAYELFHISTESNGKPKENAPGYQNPPKSEQHTHIHNISQPRTLQPTF